MKKLLETKKRLNAKRPEFKRYDHHKRKEVGIEWRKPKGYHNKTRLQHWGKPALVKTGYGSPALVRHMTYDGLLPVLVHNLTELKAVDVKTQGVILAHIGSRSKIKLLDECKKLSLTVLNVKDVDAEVKKLSSRIEERKSVKKETAPEKAVSTPEKKAEEKPKSREEEKKEMDKLLTKRA